MLLTSETFQRNEIRMHENNNNDPDEMIIQNKVIIKRNSSVGNVSCIVFVE